MIKRPALFISHGSPLIAVEDDDFTHALGALGRKQLHPHPLAAVVMSAHWEDKRPLQINSNPHPPLLYDFGGFPSELYDKVYPCPGDPHMANHIRELFTAAKIKTELNETRGLDHGVWTPLCRMFPEHNVPVVQVSLPVPRTPQLMFDIGRILSPLRSENVLLIGTGGVVHNLRKAHLGVKDALVDAWAQEFDEWVKTCLQKGDTASLLNYRKAGPQAEMAVQGPEHFEPIFFALGAADGEPVRFVYEGFHYGNLSMRSFEIGA